MLIAMTGLPGSGKSLLARALSKALPGFLLDKDEVRAFLFRDLVDYSRDQNDLCSTIMYDVAIYLLAKRRCGTVILDGRTYSRSYQVAAVKRAAERANTKLQLIECVCSPETARARLEADTEHPAEDRDFALYQRSRAAAEPIPDPKLVIDTDQHDPATCLQLALAYLRDDSG